MYNGKYYTLKASSTAENNFFSDFPNAALDRMAKSRTGRAVQELVCGLVLSWDQNACDIAQLPSLDPNTSKKEKEGDLALS